MTRNHYKIVMTVPILALIFSGCCTSPSNVRELSKQTIQNIKTLAQKQDESLTAFKKFTEDSEGQVNSLASYTQQQNQKMQALAVKALLCQLEAREAQLQVAFDDAAAQVITDKFESALESKFIGPIQTALNKLLQEEQNLKAEAEKYPNDTLARRRYDQKSIESRSFYALALEKEVELRKKMILRIVEARRSVQAKIKSGLQAIHTQLDAHSNQSSVAAILSGKITETKEEKPVFYGNIRTEIAAQGKQLQALYAAQQQSQESLDKYINRPSEAKLLLAGIFEGAKNEFKVDLPKLGELGKTLQAPLNQLLDGTEKALQKTADDLSSSIQQSINSVVADFAKNATDKVSETIKPAPQTPGK